MAVTHASYLLFLVMNPHPPRTDVPAPGRGKRWARRAVLAILVVALAVLVAQMASEESPEETAVATPTTDTENSASSSAPTSTSSTTTTLPPSTTPQPPPLGPRYQVPPTEASPEAKQLAVDIAYELTTYERDSDHIATFEAIAGVDGASDLAAAAEPATYQGSWSRGEVIYPQMGGLRNGRASVMVVVRQSVGQESEAELSVVRTMDIRLVEGDEGWEFDFLSSAGGSFDDLEDLTLAHAVAADPRIEMPDSARIDILSGMVSPTLLNLMSELADLTPYGVAVLATGHPHNVFETDRQSQHTVGQAVDIYRIGDRFVVDDRDDDSLTRTIVEWLYDHPDVSQVGSPWDVDGGVSSRSFTDAVHLDHIHLAVSG